ncbi:hypothetical protein [Edaphobacter bradus]|uniref:hypothetical protein n=1 Tax=Edaphobacter bradus TaxID=2259016 RepID=UPI0021E06851|nr:hypothetical protein [Edaphobacter bradus]
MPPQATPGDIQPQILRTYTVLHQLRRDWGGSLILSLGLDPQGAALSIAANVVGAVSLAVDNNPTHVREVVRTGACDFVVNTLDEAIRAMKNEVRKHAPLSVALNADPFLALNEIAERGLSPQLFANFLPASQQISEAAIHLHSLGAALIDFHEDTPPPAGFHSSQSLLTPLLKDQGWQLHTFTFDTPTALRTFDAKALSLLPAKDSLRRRWLEAAPRILQRQRPPHRSLWLTEAEKQALKES